MLKHIHSFLRHHYHTRYHGLYQHARQLFVFDLLLLGTAILFFGASLWLFFWKPGLADQIELTISLGDSRVKSGEEVRLTVAYSNHSKFRLNNLTLGLRLPVGFVINTARTTDNNFLQTKTLSLPTLPPGGSGVAEIYGWLWSTPRQEEKLIATLTYIPENNSQREQKLAPFLITLPESVLHGSLTIASSSFPQQNLPFIYSLSNNSNRALEGVSFSHSWKSTASEENKFHNITLAPGETKKLTGHIKTPTQGTLTVTAQPQIQIATKAIGQAGEQKNISILTPKINISSRLIDPPNFADGGGALPLEIYWDNKSSFAWSDQKIRLRFSPGIIDLPATARLNRLQVYQNDLIVDQKTRTSLANGQSENHDQFTIILQFLKFFKESNNLEITPIFEARREASDQIYSNTGATIKIPLATQAEIFAESRYYTPDGDQMGRGPLPPRLNQTTKYWIFIHLINTINALERPHFETTLPAGVTFTGKQSVTIGPELKYTPNTKLITWEFNELPANSQTGLYFEVALTPTPEQVGKEAILTSPLIFTGNDNTVDKKINLSAPRVTSKLPSDDRGNKAGFSVMP